MSETHAGARAGEAVSTGRRAALRATDWLSLAAAPTFAIMALLTSILGAGRSEIFCSAAQAVSPLSGMAPMYMLMCAFHSAPWLKLISRQRSAGDSRPDDRMRRLT